MGQAREGTYLDIIDIVTSIVVICDVDIVHVVVVVILKQGILFHLNFLVPVPTLLLLLLLALLTRLAATEAADSTKLMKVKPEMEPAGAQFGSAS